MATTIPRQPFAPLNQSRLQTLTSLKNRQNAMSSPSKRKAASYDVDNDSENIDPTFSTSPKRSKAVDGTTSFFKPSKFILTAAPPSPNEEPSVFKPASLSPPIARPMLNPRSPLRAKISSPKTPLSAPAGRSPTRKRVGILNRWRTSSNVSNFTRVDPPAFSVGAGKSGAGNSLPFTIDAALKGTIPSYGRRTTISSIPSTTAQQKQQQQTSKTPTPATSTPMSSDMSQIPELYQAPPRAGWHFEIHEDTVEEEDTNLMYHSTRTLDISSDEESSSRLRDLRGKENVPPMDDMSQTSFTPSSSSHQHARTALKGRNNRKGKDMDVDRSPLGEMPAEDFYADGDDANSTFVILEDVYEEVCCGSDYDDTAYHANIHSSTQSQGFDFSTIPQIHIDGEAQAEINQYGVMEVNGKGKGRSVEELMRKEEGIDGAKARVLEPIEKPEEGFAIWESGSMSGGEGDDI